MIDLQKKRILENNDLVAGRLGISSSYGAPVAAYEEAFERGKIILQGELL